MCDQSNAHTRATISQVARPALEPVDVAEAEHHVGLLAVGVGLRDVVRDAVRVDLRPVSPSFEGAFLIRGGPMKCMVAWKCGSVSTTHSANSVPVPRNTLWSSVPSGW